MRPSRYLAVLAAIFIVLYSILLGFGKGSVSDRLKPKLGLDLVGGTTLTLVAKTLDGAPPTAASLEQARQIIENRVNGMGVSEAEVVTEGNNNIVISVPGQNNDDIKQVGVPAQLRFRKVINATADVPSVSETPTPAPSSSASPKPSGSASPKPSATAAKPSGSAAPAAGASSSAANTSPSPSPAPLDLNKQREVVLKKLGGAAAIAQGLTDPNSATQNPGLMAQLDPFKKLTSTEVALLPPQIQFNVPQVTCEKLNGRPPGSIQDEKQPAVACEEKGDTKYLLDVGKVLGTDIASATANLQTGPGAGWKVDLEFNGAGTKKWTALTTEAYDNAGGACQVTAPNEQAGGNPVCQVAVVLDNTVVSAPGIQAVLGSKSQITGGFTKSTAQLLANQLRYGALPLTFDPGNLLSISATLGTDYLRAGLLAAGIGMLLVIVYAFFYYRLLGSVIFLSLVLSGFLTFGMLVLLGRSMGFTLSLAGMAGFIVSLGVAADSFVIYFERLKDEIREGRSPRSAIPRAWVRARRTILTANAVTVLAAVVLFLVGVGSVKGFAFALGLATTLDLVIVFLFRHPIMTMLARTPAFLSPRVSGLGRVLEHHDASASGAARTKEA
jgi:preprotein translocase subunit SecD